MPICIVCLTVALICTCTKYRKTRIQRQSADDNVEVTVPQGSRVHHLPLPPIPAATNLNDPMFIEDNRAYASNLEPPMEENRAYLYGSELPVGANRAYNSRQPVPTVPNLAYSHSRLADEGDYDYIN